MGLVRQLLVLLLLGVPAAAAASPRGSGWLFRAEDPRGAKQRALVAADWRSTVSNETISSFLRRAAAPNGAVIFTTFTMIASQQAGGSSWTRWFLRRWRNLRCCRRYAAAPCAHARLHHVLCRLCTYGGNAQELLLLASEAGLDAAHRTAHRHQEVRGGKGTSTYLRLGTSSGGELASSSIHSAPAAVPGSPLGRRVFPPPGTAACRTTATRAQTSGAR